MDDLIIYLANDCHECELIEQYLNENNIYIKTKTLTKEEWTEKGLFIFPSLFQNDNVVAYGNDIITFLK